jgi:hypothetical protein
VIDLVARVVDIPGPVSADAEEAFDALANRLPVMGRVVVPVVATVASAVGLTTGAGVVVGGCCGGMTTAAGGLKTNSNQICIL